MENIWRVIKIIPEYRGRIIGLIASSVALGFAATATPFIFRHIVNALADWSSHKITYDAAIRATAVAVIIFALFRLVLTIFSYVQEKQSDAIWLNTISTLRRRVFETMTGLSLDYYERTRVGDVMDRFSNSITITQWLFQLSEGTLANILTLLFGVAVLLVKAPLIGLIMLVLVPFNLILSYRSVQKTKPLRRRWNALVGQMSGLLSEMVSQIATVRSFSGERAVQHRYDGVQKEWWEVRTRETGIEQRSGVLVNFVNSAAVVVCVALAASAALAGRSTPGDILLVLMLTQAVITAIQPITRLVNTTGDVDAAAERLVDLLQVAPTVVDRLDAIELGSIRTIEFRNVSFSYPGKTAPALQGVSFHLDAGETLALVGPSGSGKSTIIKLAMRFYDVGAGEILINGEDIRTFTQASLRARIGAVLQDVALFNDSIADNISFARRGATLDDVRSAAELAHADVFIRKMANGYDTLVGERGVRLSGGEKQRVAIARAILRAPDLIILDEATSALDTESERLVQDGLKQLMKGRTAIVIAHRFSTVTSADQIIVMQGGKVVERGNHEGLLSMREGLYKHLHALQTGAATFAA